MAAETLSVILQLVAGQYKREAKAAASATKNIAGEAGTAGKATDQLRQRFNGAAVAIKGAAVAFAAVKLRQFVGDARDAASALNESVNAVNSVFGTAAERIAAFSRVSAQATGLSARQFNELATVSGAALQNFGFSAEQAAAETVKLAVRASDMASVFNTDVADAMGAIQSALRGETEPIRRFGVSLDDARIRAKAVEMGLADTTAAVDANGKATAALALIYDQTNKVVGDFANTSDELANSQRRAAAEAENAKAAFGQALQAPATAVTNISTDILRGLQALGLFGKGAREVTLESLRMEEAIGNINDAIRSGSPPADAFADSLLHLARSGLLSREAMLALAAAAGLSEEDVMGMADAILTQAGALDDSLVILPQFIAALTGTGDAASAADPKIAALADQYEEWARQAKAARDAQLAATQALLEAANPALAAARAMERYQSAQANLAEVQADGKSSAEDIARAQLDVASAALEAQAAMDLFKVEGVTRGADAIAKALGIGTDEALELMRVLGLLSGMEVTTVVRTRFEEIRDTRSVGSAANATRTYGGGRQHGGSVDPRHWYMVGERGPEMFIPNQTGTVASNRELMRALSGLSGGRESNITINYPQHTGNDIMHGVRTALLLDGLTQFAETAPGV